MIYKVALLTASVVAANGSAPVTTSKSDADYIASLDAEDLSNNEATDDLQVEDYDTSEFYEDILSANHAAKVFKTNTKQNSNKFWVKFPDQVRNIIIVILFYIQPIFFYIQPNE
jgi:hypothetical protein